MHIDDGLKGFPPEWENSLLQLGYSPDEIQQMVAQRQRQRDPSISVNAPSAAGTSSSAASHHTNGSTSSQYRYPTPPQQYPPAAPQVSSSTYHPLTLQTDNTSTFGDLEQYQPQMKTNSPATRAPLRNPINRSDSPANSIRSNATNSQRGRASPAPSLTREREHVLQPSNLSNSSQIPAKVGLPARPAPPPPLFSESSISTSKANAYKPPRVIAVNGDEDSDDENQPLESLRANNKQAPPAVPVVLKHRPVGSTSNGQAAQKPVQVDDQVDAQDDTPTTASQSHKVAPVPETLTNNATLKPSVSTVSADAPPRLTLSSLTIPRISLSLGSLDLGLGLDSESKEGTSASKTSANSETIEWSESLFAALPSATAFDGFRSSVIRTPGSGPSSARGSPGSNYSPAQPSPGTLGQSPATTTSRGASPLTGSTFGFGRGLSPAQSREPSPTTGTTLVAPSPLTRDISPSPSPELSPAPQASTNQPSDAGTRSTLQAAVSPLSTPSPIHDLSRDSVSSYATERASMSSFGDYGEEHEYDDGVGEAVVVTRATAVKLARAPSMSLQRNFDVFASGKASQNPSAQASGQARGVVGQTSGHAAKQSDAGMPPYAALQAQRMLYQNSAFDEEDEEDSDEDSDDQDEDEDEDEDDPDSRYTIRLGDADAGRLMDAVMKGGGVLDARQQGELNAAGLGGDVNGRPLSTSTIRKETRPTSTATIQAPKTSGVEGDYSEEQFAEDEPEGEDEDSSALDDWLEANDGEDVDASSPIPEDTTITVSPGKESEGSEYDDADRPLLDAYTMEDAGADDDDRSPESVYEAESPRSPVGSESAQSFSKEHESGDDAIPDSPFVLGAPGRARGFSKSSQTSVHGRTPGTGSGSGSSGGGSHRPQRSSMIYTPLTNVQLTAQQRDIVKPLFSFIRPGDPTTIYGDLLQVAEGESGSVYAARVLNAKPNSLPVAIKTIRVDDETRPKMEILKREMTIFSRVRHENVLSYGELWLTKGSDTELWIRMDLMERSLADLLGLIPEGLVLEERHVARFAKDVASGLAYLEKLFIAHRDVRSDNILISGNDGSVKLGPSIPFSDILLLTTFVADFGNAVQLSASNTQRTDEAGVIYWQAPEMRR